MEQWIQQSRQWMQPWTQQWRQRKIWYHLLKWEEISSEQESQRLKLTQWKLKLHKLPSGVTSKS